MQTDALKDALEDLLKRNPHLAAGASTRDTGDSDRGKGKGKGSSLEEMSVEDHVKRQSRAA